MRSYILALVLLITSANVHAQFMAAMTIEINGSEGKTIYTDPQVFCELQADGNFSIVNDLGSIKKTAIAVPEATTFRNLVEGSNIKIFGKLAQPLPQKDTTFYAQVTTEIQFGLIKANASLPLTVICKKRGVPRFEIYHQHVLFSDQSLLSPKEKLFFNGVINWSIK
jgi:hypothetical protein